jgi:hypothetical protein
MLIKIENGQPVGNPIMDDNLKLLFPNTSFPAPLSPANVEPFGYGVYIQSAEPTFGIWEKAVEITPVKNAEGIWAQTWEVVPLNPEERHNKEIGMQRTNKTNAATFLAESDWTVLPDVALQNKADWEAYRVALRNIARNPPVEVQQWPTKPPELWVE